MAIKAGADATSAVGSTLGEVELRERILANPLPRHVAIIMDGNGRWATSRGLPRAAGHAEGVKAVRNTVRAAGEIGTGRERFRAGAGQHDAARALARLELVEGGKDVVHERR